METSQVLDTPAIEKSAMEYASKGARFAHYIIDTIACYLLLFLLIMAAGMFSNILMQNGVVTLLVFLLFPSYYVIFEHVFGKTPGKFITRTHVATESGQRPTLQNIIGRSLCRLIPFDNFSFLFSSTGWHDSISKTCVVKDTPKL